MILCSSKHEHCAHCFTGFAKVLCEIAPQLLCRPSNHSLFEGLAIAVHCLETDTSFSAIIELSITYYVDFPPFHFGYCSLPIIQNDRKLFGSNKYDVFYIKMSHLNSIAYPVRRLLLRVNRRRFSSIVLV